MSRTLYGLSQSPWTERARWALDHHGVAYEYHEHVPMLGEVLLRAKARTMKASVPLFADGDDVVMGSFAITKHAERIGRGPSLFPSEKDDDIARWVDAAERMMNVGRAWFMKRALASKAVQAESLPAFVPGALRGVSASTAALGIRFLAKKYAVPDDADAEVEKTLRPVLEELRLELRQSPTAKSRTYLLSSGTFTVVDLVLAATLQVIRPHTSAKLGPATRAAWTNDALAAEFGELLEWRDAIYAAHR